MDDSQSTNPCSQSNDVKFLNQPIVLGNNHSDDDDFVDVCNDECPSLPVDLSIPQKDH